jgi:uncharacterized membrane protein
LQIGIISFAFERIGIPGEYIFFLLFLTLFGSMINIPIKKISTEVIVPGQVINFFGWRFRIPSTRYQNETLIAVNLGGALIPTAISLYIVLSKPNLLIQNIFAVTVVSFAVHLIARPVRGVGIVTPAFLPPLIAALTALIIKPSYAPLIAYVSGSLGTLIGADLMNLRRIGELGAPVASIGGAGTFDGIFLTGIFAVILTSF